jgi:hypothetical protein
MTICLPEWLRRGLFGCPKFVEDGELGFEFYRGRIHFCVLRKFYRRDRGWWRRSACWLGTPVVTVGCNACDWPQLEFVSRLRAPEFPDRVAMADGEPQFRWRFETPLRGTSDLAAVRQFLGELAGTLERSGASLGHDERLLTDLIQDLLLEALPCRNPDGI